MSDNVGWDFASHKADVTALVAPAKKTRRALEEGRKSCRSSVLLEINGNCRFSRTGRAHVCRSTVTLNTIRQISKSN